MRPEMLEPMLEILRSNDPVLINFAQSLLRQAGIDSFLADHNISVVEGSIGAFPRRMLVPTDQWEAARDVLLGANLGSALVGHGNEPA
jgi:hypothetical protein